MQALIRIGEEAGSPLAILPAVEAVNQRQKRILIPKILTHFQNDLKGRRIAVWGLAFKPKTDDLREAPSPVIVESLLELGAKVFAYDPVAMPAARSRFGDRIRLAEKNYECLRDADALVLVTEWDEFRRPNWETMKSLMKTPVIFDGRNIYDPALMRSHGFIYYGIGRPALPTPSP